jgi:redox-sensitive bicupin YhaK (pirin superfamily)
MITIRKSNERGHADHGWLDSRHTFSFADYYDPAHMGFRGLRVINEDRVAPGGGFPTHPHRDMEIFSYVLSGAIAHQDSLGNGRTLHAGQVQLMSTGRGVQHSEFNPSRSEPAHFLQIWIQPEKHGLPPRYSEWQPSPEQTSAPKVLVISHDGRDHSATIAADADVHRLLLSPGQSVTHELRPGRGLWLQVARGSLILNGTPLTAGDAASLEEAGVHTIAATAASEALLFDMA